VPEKKDYGVPGFIQKFSGEVEKKYLARGPNTPRRVDKFFRKWVCEGVGHKRKFLGGTAYPLLNL